VCAGFGLPAGPALACAVRVGPGGYGPHHLDDEPAMRNLLRALIAGYGAKKLGGGCISTVIIFIILFWLLGRVL
jgi:hypothetical protein